MSKVLFVDNFGKIIVKDLDFVPSIGMSVCFGYTPHPKVTEVLLFPPPRLIPRPKDGSRLFNSDIDVLVVVG